MKWDTDLSELTLHGKCNDGQDEKNYSRLSTWTWWGRPLSMGGHVDGRKECAREVFNTDT